MNSTRLTSTTNRSSKTIRRGRAPSSKWRLRLQANLPESSKAGKQAEEIVLFRSTPLPCNHESIAILRITPLQIESFEISMDFLKMSKQAMHRQFSLLPRTNTLLLLESYSIYPLFFACVLYFSSIIYLSINRIPICTSIFDYFYSSNYIHYSVYCLKFFTFLINHFLKSSFKNVI